MKTPYETARLGIRPRPWPPYEHLADKPRSALRRLLSAALLCLVGSCILGCLPAAASAATATGSSLPWSQPAWWSYLPGLGGSGINLPGYPSGITPPTYVGTPSPPPTTAPAGSLTNGSYTNGSGTLAYQLYVPSTYKAGTAVPLVVALHGCTQTADGFRQLTNWDKLAESKGFIVVFPQQSSSNNQFQCWNFFQQADMSRGSGEPAIIAGITQWVQQNYTVDPKRTYVAGLSAGGAMSSVMAATYPDLYAAAAIGSGCEYAATATCAGYQSADPVQAGQAAYAAMGSYARTMPVLVFEGDQDTTVPPINAQQAVKQWQTTDGLVMKNNAMPTAPTSITTGVSPGGQTYTCSFYGDGSGHELIQYWLVHGMGHAWSGGSSSQQYSDPAGPDETAAMYAFFVNHAMS